MKRTRQQMISSFLITVVVTLTGCAGVEVQNLIEDRTLSTARAESPLVIEVLDGGFDLEYLAQQIGLPGSAQKHLKENVQTYFSRNEKDTALAAFEMAERQLILVEVRHALAEYFPNSRIYIRSVPLEQQLAAARSLSTLEAHGTHGWQHSRKSDWLVAPTPALKGADVVVRVSHDQAYAPPGHGDWGTFGRAYAPHILARHVPSGRPLSQLTSTWERQNMSGAALRRCASAWEKTASAITSKQARDGSFNRILDALAHPQIAPNWFTDYDSVRYENARRGLAIWAGNSFKSVKEACGESDLNALLVDAEDLEAYRSIETSPMLPVYRQFAAQLAAEVISDAEMLHRERIESANAWASLYEPDASIREQYALLAAGESDMPPEVARQLAHTRETELAWLTGYNRLYTDFYSSEAGQQLRADKVNQQGKVTSANLRLGFITVLSLATAGVAGALAGTAGAGASVSSLTTSMNMLNVGAIKMQQSDNVRAQQQAQAIAAAIGPVALKIGTEQKTFQAGSIEELRAQLLESYQSARPGLLAADGME